jgi:protoporphyrin/coproporphyrin ferrochelatase
VADRALVVMAYGSPSSLDDVEAYYTDIRRGRPPSPEQLADLVRRYEAIGGVHTLTERTEAQRAALARALGDGWLVVVGTKHASPSIEQAVADAEAAGAGRLVGLVLAPHWSSLSVGEYVARFEAAATVPVAAVESWATEPAYVDFLAGAVRDGLAALPERTKVVFTAHSLPRRVVAAGDPYADELRATAEAVATAAGLPRWSGWSTAWQSAGRTPEPWLGPDVLEVVRDLAATGRADGLLVCPCGFTSDHLEVRYDLDIEAAGVAREVGLAFGRTRVVDDDAGVMAALAERVRAVHR